MKYLIIIAIAVISQATKAQETDLEMVLSTVNKHDIQDHIYFLASDEMRGRALGTPEIDVAADYIATTLKEYGAQPVNGLSGYFQEVPFSNVSPASKVELSFNQTSADQIAVLEAANIDYSNTLLYLNYGSVEDFEGADVKGKLVVVKGGSEGTSDLRTAFFVGRNKRQLAHTNGAVGLIEIINTDDQSWGFLRNFTSTDKISLVGPNDDQPFVHVWARQQDQELMDLVQEQVTAELTIEGVQNTTFKGKNVVAMIPGSDPNLKDEFVIYSAHYDHVGVAKNAGGADSIYNGARDNAVGVVTVLSAAKNLGKYPTQRSALFILFTAEEKGLLGSEYYVSNPAVPLNRMVFCFNSDNGGYNDTSLATIIGLNRTTANKDIVKAVEASGLKAIDDPAPEQNLFDRSDNVHFAAVGIPAPTYGLGFSAFDEEIAKYYHQVTDNPDNLDYDYLLKFFRSYVLSARYIANNPQKPFWSEGDKYYEAGLRLYQGN